MDVKNLKDLAKLVKLCRKLGLNHFKQGDLEITLANLPAKHSKTKRTVLNGKEKIDLDDLTEEQKVLWSSTGMEDIGRELNG